jgi:hypothetical protein
MYLFLNDIVTILRIPHQYLFFVLWKLKSHDPRAIHHVFVHLREIFPFIIPVLKHSHTNNQNHEPRWIIGMIFF